MLPCGGAFDVVGLIPGDASPKMPNKIVDGRLESDAWVLEVGGP